MWEINVTINEYIHFMFTLLYHQIRQLALWMTAGVCFFLPLLFSFLLVLLGFHPQICLFYGLRQSKKEMVVTVNVLDWIRHKLLSVAKVLVSTYLNVPLLQKMFSPPQLQPHQHQFQTVWRGRQALSPP